MLQPENTYVVVDPCERTSLVLFFVDFKIEHENRVLVIYNDIVNRL